MSLLDVNSDDLIKAAEQAPAPLAPKAPAQRFSTWGMFSAAPKGVAAGAAEATGSTADILGAFGQALASTGGSGKGMFATQTPEERKQSNAATDKLLKDGLDFNSEAGRSFRNVAADYTPDAQTTHFAESAVFNLFRVGSKALTSAATLGNVPGAVVAGLEEGFTQSDQLAQQGVDLETRTKVGSVTAVTNAVGFALPVAGKNWMQTVALAAAGGPASFMAQNAATREILQAADYSKLADQYDPLDPVGLALSTALPLAFGGLAMRGAKVKAKGPAPDTAPTPVPPPEIVDAARVNLVREHMNASNPAGDDIATHSAHADAYSKAMEQQAAGERVSVVDVAPKVEQKLYEWNDRESATNGEFVKADYKLTDSQPIYQMREMSPADLYLPELDSSGKLQPEKRAYLAGYVERAKAGEVPPAVTAIEMEDGRIRIVDGHRRVMAAKEAGNTIRVLVSPLIDTPAGKVEATAENIANNPIADWGANLKKSLDEMAVELNKNKPKPAQTIADTAQAATKTVADQNAFNPATLATQATDLLNSGKPVSQIIGEMEAGGTKVSPELQNMLVGASEFGGRINELVDQVASLQKQRGSSAQPFDLIAQAVENLRTGQAAEAPKQGNPLESRLEAISFRNPQALDAEIALEFGDDGKPTRTMPARDYLEMVKKEAAQDSLDAGLIEVAANCFLSGGM